SIKQNNTFTTQSSSSRQINYEFNESSNNLSDDDLNFNFSMQKIKLKKTHNCHCQKTSCETQTCSCCKHNLKCSRRCSCFLCGQCKNK
ncbi:16470_t:CDS:2, partial [Cetraspora pellucida]